MSLTTKPHLLVLFGSLLLQLGWILSVPPFHGIDEFDHVYRAAAVARGDWDTEREVAPNGRGGIVSVPQDLVKAAQARCEQLPYTADFNCHAIEQLPGGLVTVVSTATTQSPMLYAVVGFAARPFSGDAADYVMRVMAAIMCSALLALAAWAATVGSRTAWPLFGLFASITPVFVYSSMLPAGNGLEIAAGIGLWTSLVALARNVSMPDERRLLMIATASAVLLVSLRQLGPVFLGLALLICAVYLGADTVRAVIGRQRWTALAGGAFVVAAGLGHLAWIRAVGYATPGQVVEEHRWSDFPQEIVLWLMQAFATGSFRNQAAPIVVYPLILIVVGALVVAAFRLPGMRRERFALGAAIVICVLLPVAFVLATYSTRGSFWQGRYGLAFGVGVMVLAGAMLNQSRSDHRLSVAARGTGMVMLALASVFTALGVRAHQEADSVGREAAGWLPHPIWLIVLVTLVGWSLYAYALKFATAQKSGTARKDLAALEDAGEQTR